VPAAWRMWRTTSERPGHWPSAALLPKLQRRRAPPTSSTRWLPIWPPPPTPSHLCEASPGQLATAPQQGARTPRVPDSYNLGYNCILKITPNTSLYSELSPCHAFSMNQAGLFGASSAEGLTIIHNSTVYTRKVSAQRGIRDCENSLGER
jgi:hypothetical protein